MKKLTCVLMISTLVIATKSFSQNPFESLGVKNIKVLTFSNGKYNEFFDNDSIVQIGSVLFNTKSNEIVAFVKTDTTYSEATLKPEITSRWLSPDPLAAKYPFISPYVYAVNNPILVIDPDGRDTMVVHRSSPMAGEGDAHTNIYRMTYSVIQNGSEMVLPESGLIMGNAESAKSIPYTTLDKPFYTLHWKGMTLDSWLQNTINITGNSFFHAGNDYRSFKGCYGMSDEHCTIPFRYSDDTKENVGISNTQSALDNLRNTYNFYNGPNQDQLTGEKFLLQTNSVAEIKKIEPKQVQSIPMNEQTPQIITK